MALFRVHPLAALTEEKQDGGQENCANIRAALNLCQFAVLVCSFCKCREISVFKTKKKNEMRILNIKCHSFRPQSVFFLRESES